MIIPDRFQPQADPQPLPVPARVQSPGAAAPVDHFQPDSSVPVPAQPQVADDAAADPRNTHTFSGPKDMRASEIDVKLQAPASWTENHIGVLSIQATDPTITARGRVGPRGS